MRKTQLRQQGLFKFCSGMAFGVAKKNFDEIDRAGFGGFVKKVRTMAVFAVFGIEVIHFRREQTIDRHE